MVGWLKDQALLTDEETNLFPAVIDIVEDEDTGLPYIQWYDNDGWVWMGYVPRPKTRLGWVVHHILHGVLMHYPLHKVLLYACLYSKEERDD